MEFTSASSLSSRRDSDRSVRPSPERKKIQDDVEGLHIELEQLEEEQADLEAGIAHYRAKEEAA